MGCIVYFNVLGIFFPFFGSTYYTTFHTEMIKVDLQSFSQKKMSGKNYTNRNPFLRQNFREEHK